MKRYNVISAGVGHQMIESISGDYMLASDCEVIINALNADVRRLEPENRNLQSVNQSLSSELERHSKYCHWDTVTATEPPSMKAGADAPIRLGWDGSNAMIPNSMVGYCVHVGSGKIWLDCKGNDLNLGPDQQPTHWGSAILPPGV